MLLPRALIPDLLRFLQAVYEKSAELALATPEDLKKNMFGEGDRYARCVVAELAGEKKEVIGMGLCTCSTLSLLTHSRTSSTGVRSMDRSSSPFLSFPPPFLRSPLLPSSHLLSPSSFASKLNRLLQLLHLDRKAWTVPRGSLRSARASLVGSREGCFQGAGENRD